MSNSTDNGAVPDFLDAVAAGRWPPAGGLEPDEGAWSALRPRLEEAGRGIPWPDGLVARPPPMPAPAWHADRLRDPGLRLGSAANTVRAVFHARWLAHVLAPDAPRYHPRVSIVIPVYNRAKAAGQAVASGLGQSYPATEIVVVDDGSTDELGEVLAAFGDRIRVVTQDNKGVGAARNAGISAATGDYIHFLDSDDVLHPDCLRRKIAAFAAVPDADLCFHRLIEIGPRGLRFSSMRKSPPDGGPSCPTTDFMASVARRMPFPPSATMIPRWRALAAPGFDEDIHLGEDHRYLFTLARGGLKACGLRDRLTLKRESSDSLSIDQTRNVPSLRLARLRTLVDVFETPAEWRYLPPVIRPPSIATILWTLDFPAGDDARDSLCRRLLAAVAAYGDGNRRDAKSPLIALHLLHLACGARLRTKRGRFRRGTFNAVLAAALRQAIQGAAALTATDLSEWRRAEAGRSAENGVLALLDGHRIAPEDDRAAQLLTEAIRAWSAEPGSRHWSILYRLVPKHGLDRAIARTERLAALTAPDTWAGRTVAAASRFRTAARTILRVPLRHVRVAIRRIRSAASQNRILREAGFPPL